VRIMRSRMSGPDNEGADLSRPDAVSVSKVRLLGAFGGQVMIEWELTVPPDPRWIEAFTRAPTEKRGSSEWVMGSGGEPLVYPEGTIRWSVPHADLRGAAAFVLESVVYANSRLIDHETPTEGDRESGAWRAG
jgi:hypothetical protein